MNESIWMIMPPIIWGSTFFFNLTLQSIFWDIIFSICFNFSFSNFFDVVKCTSVNPSLMSINLLNWLNTFSIRTILLCFVRVFTKPRNVFWVLIALHTFSRILDFFITLISGLFMINFKFLLVSMSLMKDSKSFWICFSPPFLLIKISAFAYLKDTSFM